MAKYKSPTANATPVDMMGPINGNLHRADNHRGAVFDQPKVAMPAETKISSQ